MKKPTHINQVPKEDLHYLLPKSLREALEDKDPNFSSPKTIQIQTEPDCLNTTTSLKTTPSPQIPPLESRLHSYLLKKSALDEVPKPCNLSQFFSDKSINQEIQLALNEIPQKLKMFDSLENSNFFEVVKKEILDYQKTARSKLNAQAVSFVPDWNKENITLKLKIK